MVKADYSASAVNLTNPVGVLDKLESLRKFQLHRETLEALIADKCEEETQLIKDVDKEISTLTSEIKQLVDTIGSYQDTEAGLYAVKQRRVSFTYSPEAVKKVLPDYSKALIEETVNSAKLLGLQKGGLITPEQVTACVGETRETFAYIIKAGEKS